MSHRTQGILLVLLFPLPLAGGGTLPAELRWQLALQGRFHRLCVCGCLGTQFRTSSQYDRRLFKHRARSAHVLRDGGLVGVTTVASCVRWRALSSHTQVGGEFGGGLTNAGGFDWRARSAGTLHV